MGLGPVGAALDQADPIPTRVRTHNRFESHLEYAYLRFEIANRRVVGFHPSTRACVWLCTRLGNLRDSVSLAGESLRLGIPHGGSRNRGRCNMLAEK